jgi:hypothetical protein
MLTLNITVVLLNMCEMGCEIGTETYIEIGKEDLSRKDYSTVVFCPSLENRNGSFLPLRLNFENVKFIYVVNKNLKI